MQHKTKSNPIPFYLSPLRSGLGRIVLVGVLLFLVTIILANEQESGTTNAQSPFSKEPAKKGISGISKRSTPQAKTSPSPEIFSDPIFQSVTVDAKEMETVLAKNTEQIYRFISKKKFTQQIAEIQARQSAKATPPKLIEMQYNAELQKDEQGRYNLTGNGEWRILKINPQAGLLDLEPFQLAVNQMRWSDNQTAILGALDRRFPNRFQLLVEKNRQSTLVFDWSIRGLEEPSQIRFPMRLPPAPHAVLSLTIPDNLTPTINPSEGILIGPINQQGDQNHRKLLWQIRFANSSQLDLIFRKNNLENHQTNLRYRLRSVQELTANEARYRFDFNLEVARADLNSINLVHSNLLTPTDVIVNNIASWSDTRLNNKENLLQIHLREPLRTGKIEIIASGPIPLGENRPWLSPAISIQNGILQSETLECRIAPDLTLVDWHPHSFHLNKIETSSEGVRILFLESIHTSNTQGTGRPQAKLQTLHHPLNIQENIRWVLNRDQESIQYRAKIQLSHGLLPQLQLQIPPNCELIAPEITPRELLPDFSKKQNQLQIDFTNPPNAKQTFELSFQLIRPIPFQNRSNSATVTFPQFHWLNEQVINCTGSLHLEVANNLRSYVQSTAFDLLTATALNKVASPNNNNNSGSTNMLPADIPYVAQMPVGTIILQRESSDHPPRCYTSIHSIDNGFLIDNKLELPSWSGNQKEFILQTSRPLDHWEVNLLAEENHAENQIIAIDPLPITQLSAMLSLALSPALPNSLLLVASATTGSGSASPFELPRNDAVDKFPNVSPKPSFPWTNSPLAKEQTVFPRWYRLKFLAPIQDSSRFHWSWQIDGGQLTDTQHFSHWLELLAPTPFYSLPSAFPCLASQMAKPRIQLKPKKIIPDKKLWPIPIIQRIGGIAVQNEIQIPPGYHLQSSKEDSGGEFIYETAEANNHDEKNLLYSWPASQRPPLLCRNLPGPKSTSEPDQAQLLTSYRGGSYCENYLSFCIHNPSPAGITLSLPAIAKIRSLLISGKQSGSKLLSVLDPQHSLRHYSLALPVNRSIWVDLIYDLPVETGSIFYLKSPPPLLDNVAIDLRRFWQLDPDFLSCQSPPLITSKELLFSEKDSAHPLRINSRLSPADLKDVSSHYQPILQQLWSKQKKVLLSDFLCRTNQLKVPLLIDRWALAKENIALDSFLAKNSLLEAQLLILQSPYGNLLTTRQMVSHWQNDQSTAPAFPAQFQADLRIAFRFGCDSTGRWINSWNWLHNTDFTNSLSLFQQTSLADNCYFYPNTEQILLIRKRDLTSVSVALTLIILLICRVICNRSPRSVPRRFIYLSALFFILYIFIPINLRPLIEFPYLGLTSAFLIWIIRQRPPSACPVTIIGKKSAISEQGSLTSNGPVTPFRNSPLIIGITCLFLQPLLALSPEIPTVYELRPAESETGNSSAGTVAAPQTLLNAMQDYLDNPLQLPPALMIRSRYEGRIRDDFLEIQASLLVKRFSETTKKIIIPFTQIRLQESTCNGTPIYPQISDDGLIFELPSVGEHQLELKFFVPIHGSRNEREIRFGIPEIGQTQLRIRGPEKIWQQLDFNQWRGQFFIRDEKQQSILEAELGRSKQILLRWQETRQTNPESINIRSWCFWSLNRQMNSLYSVFEIRPGQNWLRQIHLAVPKNLEIVRLELRTITPQLNPPPSWIRAWYLQDLAKSPNQQKLTVQLQMALTTPARLYLELVPRQFNSNRPWLTIPYSLDDPSSPTQIALGSDDMEFAEKTEIHGVSELTTLTTFQETWKKFNWGPALTAVKLFQSLRLQIPSLRPELKIPQNQNSCQHLSTIQINPGSYRFHIHSIWKANSVSSTSSLLSLLECELPNNYQVREIHARQLHSWSITGNRLQIWFKYPTAELPATIEVDCWGELPSTPENIQEIPLIPIRCPGIAKVQNSWDLVLPSSWGYRDVSLTGITHLSSKEPGIHYQSTHSDDRGIIQLLPPASIQTKLLQKVNRLGDQLQIEWSIQIVQPQNRAAKLKFQLLQSSGFTTQLLAQTASGPAPITTKDANQWPIVLPDPHSLHSPTGAVSFTLSATRNFATTASLQLPQLILLQGNLPIVPIEYRLDWHLTRASIFKNNGFQLIQSPPTSAPVLTPPSAPILTPPRAGLAEMTRFISTDPVPKLLFTFSPQEKNERIAENRSVSPILLAGHQLNRNNHSWQQTSRYLVHVPPSVAPAPLLLQIHDRQTLQSVLINQHKIPIIDPLTTRLQIPISPLSDICIFEITTRWEDSMDLPIWNTPSLFQDHQQLHPRKQWFRLDLPEDYRLATRQDLLSVSPLAEVRLAELKHLIQLRQELKDSLLSNNLKDPAITPFAPFSNAPSTQNKSSQPQSALLSRLDWQISYWFLEAEYDQLFHRDDSWDHLKYQQIGEQLGALRSELQKEGILSDNMITTFFSSPITFSNRSSSISLPLFSKSFSSAGISLYWLDEPPALPTKRKHPIISAPFWPLLISQFICLPSILLLIRFATNHTRWEQLVLALPLFLMQSPIYTVLESWVPLLLVSFVAGFSFLIGIHLWRFWHFHNDSPTTTDPTPVVSSPVVSSMDKQ